MIPHNFQLLNCTFLEIWKNYEKNLSEFSWFQKKDFENLILLLEPLKDLNLGTPVFGCEEWFYDDADEEHQIY